MSFRYHATFDVSTLGLGNISLATSGHTTFSVDMSSITATDGHGASSSLFTQYYITSGNIKVVGEDPVATERLLSLARKSYLKALKDALIAAAIANGWGATPAIGLFRDTSGFTEITYTASITVTFATVAGARMLGFTSTSPTAGTIVLGNATPDFTIWPTLQATSLVSSDYEPENIANHVIPDSGAGGFGLSRTYAPLYRDWTQQYERKERTLRRFKLNTHPYTFQQMFETLRGEKPFLIEDSAQLDAAEAFFLRTEGTSWQPSRAAADRVDDTHWHIPFKTVLEGFVVDTGE